MNETTALPRNTAVGCYESNTLATLDELIARRDHIPLPAQVASKEGVAEPKATYRLASMRDDVQMPKKKKRGKQHADEQ